MKTKVKTIPDGDAVAADAARVSLLTQAPGGRAWPAYELGSEPVYSPTARRLIEAGKLCACALCGRACEPATDDGDGETWSACSGCPRPPVDEALQSAGIDLEAVARAPVPRPKGRTHVDRNLTCCYEPIAPSDTDVAEMVAHMRRTLAAAEWPTYSDDLLATEPPRRPGRPLEPSQSAASPRQPVRPWSWISHSRPIVSWSGRTSSMAVTNADGSHGVLQYSEDVPTRGTFAAWFRARVARARLAVPSPPPQGHQACWYCGVSHVAAVDWRLSHGRRLSCGGDYCSREAMPAFLADTIWGRDRVPVREASLDEDELQTITWADLRALRRRMDRRGGPVPAAWGDLPAEQRPAPNRRPWAWITRSMVDAWHRELVDLDEHRADPIARRERLAAACRQREEEERLQQLVDQRVAQALKTEGGPSDG